MVGAMAEAQSPEQERRKFTVDEVMRMVSAGIIDEDDRVELIEGELYLMSPQDPPHAGTTGKLNMLLTKIYAQGFTVRVQLPLLASQHSMPEPDFAIVRGEPGQYETRHPSGADTVLVIEVTWSSERMDRRKVGIYAAAGVPVYWRLDLPRRRLEVHEVLDAQGTYTLLRVLDEGAEVALPGLPGTQASVRVAELLPARQ
jgi:Uma2 family endonuclease